MVLPIIVGTNGTGASSKPDGRKTTQDFLNSLLPGGQSNVSGGKGDIGSLLGGNAPSSGNPSPGLGSLLLGQAPSSVAPTPNDKSPLATLKLGEALAKMSPTDLLGGGAGGAGGGAGGGGANTPLTFAAALRLASKEMGGFDSSPYDQALAALQDQAHSQTHIARRTGHQAEADDAVLYGHLKNYISTLAGAGREDTRSTLHGLNQDYHDLHSTINHTYGQVDNETNRQLAQLGLAPTAGASTRGSQRYAESRAATSKAESKADERIGGSGFDNLMRQTKGDVVATGTGKIADEKGAIADAINQIQAALAQQSAGIHGSEATASSSYNTQLRQAAMSLLSQNAANDPHSLDNRLKRLSLAEGYQKLKQERAGVPTPTGGVTSPGATAPGKYYSGALNFLQQQADLGKKKGIDPSHLQTLDTLLSAISEGGTPFPKILNNSPTIPNSQNLDTLLVNADKLIQNATIAKGYTAADKAALEEAVRYLVGQP